MKIYTFAEKRPDFIPLQVKALRHFLKDDFEFGVFDIMIMMILDGYYEKI